MAYTTIGVLPDAQDFADAKASIIEQDDGHIAVVTFELASTQGALAMQCSGDGARTLVEGLRLLADKVEAAHMEWLRSKVTEQDEQADRESAAKIRAAVTDEPTCGGCGAQGIDPDDRFHQADSNESYPCCRGDRASWLAEQGPVSDEAPDELCDTGQCGTCWGCRREAG